MGDTLRTSALLFSIVITSGIASATSINIVAGSGLSGNAAALAAFNRAADAWESWLTDPISVQINADLLNLGSPSIIGSTSSVTLQADYNTIRGAMVADALLDEAIDDAIVASLPTAAGYSLGITSGFLPSGLVSATKANLKALGFTGLDAGFGASDANMQFNSGFAFDYDRSNGIASGTIDFESVALHEIGHALGFVSAVDDIDSLIDQNRTANLNFYTLDMFRFPAATVITPANFGSATRSFVAGAAAKFSDGSVNFSMSTGFYTGDGRQASHWKDNELTGTLIGIMDPTIGFQETRQLSYADLRALDVIGWDFKAAAFAAVPEPATFVCFGLGLAGLAAYRRRRAA